MSNDFEIRTMTLAEVDFAIGVAANEGWNPGLHDARAFYAADPNGFFIGLLDGEPIGCISAVSYDGANGEVPFGFVGFYVVVPEQRSLGYGIQLWRHAMAYLANHNIGLDGVVEQQANYQKSGFKLAYRDIRFMGVAQRAKADDEVVGVVPIQSIPFEQVSAYDQKFFPAQRPTFLREWINLPDSKALAFVEGNEIRGYGVIRKCLAGYKIAPLFADEGEIAEAIFTSLAAYAADDEAGSVIYLDVPECNPAALALAARHALSAVFETARMYTGDAPNIAIDGVYGVTSLELG